MFEIKTFSKVNSKLLLLIIFFSLALTLEGYDNQNDIVAIPKATVTFSDKTAQDVIKESNATQWDLVIIGDSVMWGFATRYLEALEEDLGIEIKINNWSIGGDHSSKLLQRLRTNPELRHDLSEADIIIFEIPWNVVEAPLKTLCGWTSRDCGGDDNQDCLREAFNTYKSDTDGIIAEIVSIRSPSEALIRTMDTYIFNVGLLREHDLFKIIRKYWQDANSHVIEEAAKYNIPAARVYYAFMGGSGNEDPMEKDLVYDGFHTTEKGITLMVELFRQIGYAYAPEQ
ncbi:MAG: SGNH/GDSL hydrolase family protein [Kosmotogaceae bacterium]